MGLAGGGLFGGGSAGLARAQREWLSMTSYICHLTYSEVPIVGEK